MDIGKIQAFLSGLGQSAGIAQTAADNAPVLGATLLGYVIGSSPTSKDGFDGILAALTSKWGGDAADAFATQAQTVRSFGIGVAALSDWSVQPQLSAEQQQYAAGYLTDYNDAATTINQIFSDTHHRYQAATSGPNDFGSWTSYMAQFLRAAWQGNPPDAQIAMTVPTFAEFVDGSRVDVSMDDNGDTVYNTSGPGKPSGVLTLYTDPSPLGNDTSHFTYQNPEYGSSFQLTVVWNVWPWETGGKDGANQGFVKQATQDSEYNNYLRKLMVDLGNQYPLVQAPPPQDNSVLPKANGSSSSSQSSQNYSGSWTPGYGAGAGTALGGVSNGSIPGIGTGSPNGGAYNPGIDYGGSYNPGPLLPGSAFPGSPNGGGGPTQLAGYNPSAVGASWPGATGFADGGPGAFGGGDFPGVTAAAGANGPAAGGLAGENGLGADAGLAGAAGRAMPMAPMAGIGGAKEGRERQRAAWLTEEEDVWGAADDGGDAVL